MPRKCVEDAIEDFLVHFFHSYQVFESFDALDGFLLPPKWKFDAASALLTLIASYEQSKDRNEFLVKCIGIFLGQFSELLRVPETFLKWIIAILSRMKPEIYANDLWRLQAHLRTVDGFSTLVVKALADQDALRHREEELLRAMNDLPIEAVKKHGAELVAIGKTPKTYRDITWQIVEVLTRAGEWHRAVEVCQYTHDQIPDTTEFAIRKRLIEQHLIAAQFEASIADGKLDQLLTLRAAWNTAASTIKQIEDQR